MPAWEARIRLLRPGNAVMAAAGVLVGALVASTTAAASTGPWTWLAAAAAAALVAAHGNIQNDRNDAAIDRTAHPTRPIASGRVSLDEALALAWFTAIAALGLAAVAGPATLLLAGANLCVLALYESRLKARGLPGNLAVAYLVGSTFLFGAAATGLAPGQWGYAWLVAAMAFLVNVAREVLKDLQDAAADRGHRMTWPMVQPAPVVRMVAFGCVALAVTLSLAPILRRPPSWSVAWLGLLAPADGILLLGSLAAPRSVGVAQRMLKAGMAVALLAFAGAAFVAYRATVAS